MISKNKSPKFWPQRIPFAAGISNKQTKLFYYQFEPLGYSKLIDIPILDPPIHDVAITRGGTIFSITSANFYIHQYDFKSKNILKQAQHTIQSPLKCVSNHQSTVSILFKHSLNLYRYRNNKLSLIPAISNKINATLSNHRCITMSINPKGYMLVLTETNLLFFSPNGFLLKSLPNSPRYDLVDFTSYGDYLLGSSSHTSLVKYTSNGFLLFNSPYLNPQEVLSELIIYQPYGNLCLISHGSGAYYSMNTSLSIDSATYSINASNQLAIKTNFLLTFPSLVTITILDSNNNRVTLEHNKKLSSGSHQLSWDKLDSNFKKKSIYFTVKALYSGSNTVEKNYLLIQSL
ncbi:hypothetical protein CL658_01825 [bacterium]|nr:hypothetical protein [bacterium]